MGADGKPHPARAAARRADDHIDHNAAVGQKAEQTTGAGTAAQTCYGDHGYAVIAGNAPHAPDGGAFPAEGGTAILGCKGRTHLYPHLLFPRQFHRAAVKHLCPQRGHFQHFVIRDLPVDTCLRHHPGIGRAHPFYVGIDPADVGLDGGRQRHGSGVRAAPADGGDLAFRTEPLESGHHGHLSCFQRFQHAARLHRQDPGVAVTGVGADPGLPTAQRLRGTAQGLQLHGQQRHGHLFAAGQKHVFFPWRRVTGDLTGFCQQLVGGITLRRHHHRHLMSLLPLPQYQLRRTVDVRGGSQRRTAEFHHDAHMHPSCSPCSSV